MKFKQFANNQRKNSKKLESYAMKQQWEQINKLTDFQKSFGINPKQVISNRAISHQCKLQNKQKLIPNHHFVLKSRLQSFNIKISKKKHCFATFLDINCKMKKYLLNITIYSSYICQEMFDGKTTKRKHNTNTTL